ncbi:type II toxin-antitoxin system RelE/ParE family toxin [Bradyrhizobium sp. YR681]|uniref:type II toxin-antitoxin system RelE/ParE family toxin n=1 Tax=Bradyrhizobium sp. YR681 TaxID=1144344 RepID=UPI0006844F8B|nr:type II toxin-antitoxin system RelE/ParE family toxin [Bradyrhizobium sp. YR681]
MRIFKTKTLAKFTRQNGISDAALVDAVDRAKRGLIDADLGGKVIKQRVARPGQGRRGGFRMLIGFGSDRAVYLFAFAKNERENIGSGELLTLREIAASFLDAYKKSIDQALSDGTLIEVHNGNNKSKEEGKDQSSRKGVAGNGE